MAKSLQTEESRKAAMAGRRAKLDARPEVGTPQVYVVRSTTSARSYLWEIRVHGGVLLDRDGKGHPTAEAALRAGQERLAATTPQGEGRAEST